MENFFKNLSYFAGKAGTVPRQLAIEIGRDSEYVSDIIHRRRLPDLEAIHAFAAALHVDVTELLRPRSGPPAPAYDPGRGWAEKLAEQILRSSIGDASRADDEPPTCDDVLNWWHSNGGRLREFDGFRSYVELFDPPDTAIMRPMPHRMGARSLAAREMHIDTAQQLQRSFDGSEPEVVLSVALAHANTLEGKPKLSYHSILIELSADELVKLNYSRLLLPVQDEDGRRYVMNYSRAVRRSRIDRGCSDAFAQARDRKPVFVGLE